MRFNRLIVAETLLILSLSSQPTHAISNYPQGGSPAPTINGAAVGNITADHRDASGQLPSGRSTGFAVRTSSVSTGQFVLTSAHSVTASESSREVGFAQFSVRDPFLDLVDYPGLPIVHPDYALNSNPDQFDVAILLTESPHGSDFSIASVRPSAGTLVSLFGTGTASGSSTFRREGKMQYSGIDANFPNLAVFTPGPQTSDPGDSGGPYLAPSGVFAVHRQKTKPSDVIPNVPIGTRIDQGSATYSWVSGSTIADLKPSILWIPDYPFADFTAQELQPNKVLNANYPDRELAYSMTSPSIYIPAVQVLGLFNNEVLTLNRDNIFGSGGTGAGGDSASSSGGLMASPEVLIVGESGTYNGSQGKIHINGGTLVTRSLRNAFGGKIEFNSQPISNSYPYRPKIEITGPNGFLNEGTVTGDVYIKLGVCINRGSIAPGHSPGIMNLDGRFIQDHGGTLAIELGGTQAAAQYDVLSIDGTASLGGTLDIQLIAPNAGEAVFSPSQGQVFEVLTASQGIEGSFREVQLPQLSSSFVWDIDYRADSVRLSVLSSESIAGDFDRNGTVDNLDYAVWQRQFGLRGSLAADGNANGIVDAADFTIWRDHLMDDSLPGDFSSDGIVDTVDYELWKNTFGSTVLLNADANGDGAVNAADYTVWLDHYSHVMGTNSASTGVPEPSSLLLIGFVLSIYTTLRAFCQFVLIH